MRRIPIKGAGTWHARWRGCDHFHRAERTERCTQAHKGLQKKSIDVSRVCKDEEHSRDFVRIAQPIDRGAILIVMYIEVCCVEAFENGQV